MTEFKKDIPTYEVLTVKNVSEKTEISEELEEQYTEDLYEEQEAKLSKLGYEDDGTTLYVIHFFNTYFSDNRVDTATIYDATQELAIKDGADLVEFNNGNIGFVSYYNGHVDAFEIIGKVEK